MARRKSKKGRRAKKKIPIFATAGAAGTGFVLYNTAVTSGYEAAAKGAVGIGSSGKVEKAVLVEVYTPVALGIVGSTIASKIGANKHLAKIPFIGDILRF